MIHNQINQSSLLNKTNILSLYFHGISDNICQLQIHQESKDIESKALDNSRISTLW